MQRDSVGWRLGEDHFSQGLLEETVIDSVQEWEKAGSQAEKEHWSPGNGGRRGLDQG